MATKHPAIGGLVILLVEDNEGDAELTRAAFESQGVMAQLVVVRDGQKALDYLFRRGTIGTAPRPDLVLLDLNLPFVKGQEVLRQMKGSEALRHIPVIVLTMSSSPEDVFQAYRNGAAAYIPKPVDFQEFLRAVDAIKRFWLESVKLPGHSAAETLRA